MATTTLVIEMGQQQASRQRRTSCVSHGSTKPWNTGYVSTGPCTTEFASTSEKLGERRNERSSRGALSCSLRVYYRLITSKPAAATAQQVERRRRRRRRFLPRPWPEEHEGFTGACTDTPGSTLKEILHNLAFVDGFALGRNEDQDLPRKRLSGKLF